MAWVARGSLAPQLKLSHTHEQSTPSTVWDITHGLTFAPAGIEVSDHAGTQHYPLVTYPNSETVRLQFRRPVSGVARLS